ncbi:MAG: hypothetical protein AB1393_13405 [Candidatus Edwardsbacteria bacterium]
MEGTTQVSGEKPVEVGGSGVVSLIRKVNRVYELRTFATCIHCQPNTVMDS